MSEIIQQMTTDCIALCSRDTLRNPLFYETYEQVVSKKLTAHPSCSLKLIHLMANSFHNR